MKRRLRNAAIYGAVCALGVLLLRWDMESRPLRQKDGRSFTVIEAQAVERGSGATVAIVRSDLDGLVQPSAPDAELTIEQVEGMVRRATELGEMEQVVRRAAAGAEGDLWVVIKPNIVELKERGSGVITDWRVVRAIARVVDELAPGARITIAEGAAWVPPPREEVLKRLPFVEVGDGFEVAGYRQLLNDPELADIRLEIVDLNFDEVVETPVPGKWYAQETFSIPRTVLECDLLIDAPVMKITDTVGMTMAMKNLVGIAPGMVYGWAKMVGFPPGSGNPGIPHSSAILDETIVDLTSLAGVDFSVVDAIVGMEKAKTDASDGIPVRMNTIVAGADVVAVDAVCARLMGLNPNDFEYLTLAQARGWG